jgi:hypothetical protein
LESEFSTGLESAEEKETGIPVDILFPGDDWALVIPLPDPGLVCEYDEEFKACFLPLKPLIELKTAVYLGKKKDEGPELAAKDLADVVMLIENNLDKLAPEDFMEFHPDIRLVVTGIYNKLIQRK